MSTDARRDTKETNMTQVNNENQSGQSTQDTQGTHTPEHEQHKEQQSDEAKEQQEQKDRRDPTKIWRCLFAELLGTFLLTFVAAGAEVFNELSHGQLNVNARVIAPGLLVMVMIYTVGGLSGAHFNPAVTLAFAMRRDFLWRRVPGYILAQLLGGILAAAVLRLLFGLTAHVGASTPHDGTFNAFVIETILTFLLVTVILGTSTNHKLTGHNAALAVGATIALAGLFAYPASGASMNPARSLGPFIVEGQLEHAWIYILGPLLGSTIAVGVAWLLRGKTTPEAVQTASGE